MILPDCIYTAIEGLIYPLSPKTREGVLSYGCSPLGYDLRLGTEFAFPSGSIDPKDKKSAFEFRTHSSPFWLLSGQFCLARSVETLSIPIDCLGIIYPKSTIARCGIIQPSTVLENGWRGEVTFELYNPTPFPVRLYPNEGFAQVVFYQAKCVPTSTYSGNYQDQIGVTTAKVAS